MAPLLFLKPVTMNEVLSSISGKYTLVRGFDQNGAQTYDPSLPDHLNTLKYLGGGYGIWIKMNEAAILDITEGR